MLKAIPHNSAASLNVPFVPSAIVSGAKITIHLFGAAICFSGMRASLRIPVRCFFTNVPSGENETLLKGNRK